MKKIKGEIILKYPSSDDALTIQNSLQVDDGSFVKSQVDGPVLKAQVESLKIPSFLHTLDDYLSCVTVAENLLSKNIGKNEKGNEEDIK